MFLIKRWLGLCSILWKPFYCCCRNAVRFELIIIIETLRPFFYFFISLLTTWQNEFSIGFYKWTRIVNNHSNRLNFFNLSFALFFKCCPEIASLFDWLQTMDFDQFKFRYYSNKHSRHVADFYLVPPLYDLLILNSLTVANIVFSILQIKMSSVKRRNFGSFLLAGLNS